MYIIRVSCVSHLMRFLEKDLFGSPNVSPRMSAETYIGPSGDLAILHFVVDVYRGTTNFNKDLHPRRCYSEGQVCHNKEFYVRHMLLHQRMSIPEDVYRGGRGNQECQSLEKSQEHPIRCVIRDDYHWICITIHELCQQ